ncbi:DEAD/DEAH box helicase [Halobacillus sp. Nhm2S1]|uniref:DEAD/DEAH box helicase n=1 Tax=Halobacillus sp. Nhm2S1 TaxID=2866716 RepID=UPI001C734461|nr:helicase-related protein [Halobacillus sp. Nhm2S1]MBX0357542.1 DEAD/DEAH box helicase family protein [Halobacillus sp. Nhm2S1]
MFKTVKKYLQKDFSWIPSENPTHSYPSLTGKLLLRHEIPLEDEIVDHLIAQTILTKVTSIESYPWAYRCRRCGNTKSYMFAKMPHATCGQTCVYCRFCIQMGRVVACEPLYYGSSGFEWPLHEHPCQWKGELTVHQQKAADELVALVRTGKGEKLVWAVCGAGKTEILFRSITEALKNGKRICLATPRTDVVRELLPRLQKSFPKVNIQALYGDSPDKAGDAPFIIATTHQLLRFAHAFDVMVIDEVDAFPFHNDASLHYASERAAKPQASMIYLTATPRKKQKRRIRSKDLPVVFIPQRFHGHPLPVPQLKLTPALHRYLQKAELHPKILQQIAHQQQTPRQLLLFLPSVKMAEQIAEYLKERNYEVRSVHAEDRGRAGKIQAFRKKEYRVLVTTTILERGVTFPSVDVYVIDAGHVVFDEAALVQIAGRAGRSPDDPKGDVIFYHVGKTDEMLDAVDSIHYMNRLGRKL